MVSFTNKAVNELKDRIQKELDIPCPIATFHSTYEGLHYSESITEGKLKKLKKQLEGNKTPFDM